MMPQSRVGPKTPLDHSPAGTSVGEVQARTTSALADRVTSGDVSGARGRAHRVAVVLDPGGPRGSPVSCSGRARETVTGSFSVLDLVPVALRSVGKCLTG